MSTSTIAEVLLAANLPVSTHNYVYLIRPSGPPLNRWPLVTVSKTKAYSEWRGFVRQRIINWFKRDNNSKYGFASYQKKVEARLLS